VPPVSCIVTSNAPPSLLAADKHPHTCNFFDIL
jgi:hypothetical protein